MALAAVIGFWEVMVIPNSVIVDEIEYKISTRGNVVFVFNDVEFRASCHPDKSFRLRCSSFDIDFLVYDKGIETIEALAFGLAAMLGWDGAIGLGEELRDALSSAVVRTVKICEDCGVNEHAFRYKRCLDCKRKFDARLTVCRFCGKNSHKITFDRCYECDGKR